MSSLQPKELLVSKVTKESLEDVAAKAASRLEKRLPWFLLIPFAVLLLPLVLPASLWWALVPLMLGFAAFFMAEQHRLETLKGRAAGRTSRKQRNSSRALV
jgi:hypothetical protein